MPVTELGTINSGQSKNEVSGRLNLAVDQMLLKDDAWWHTALFVGQGGVAGLSVLLLFAALGTSGDTVSAPQPGGSTLTLSIGGHPEVPPCASNRYDAILYEHAPFRFTVPHTAASVKGARKGVGEPQFIGCGWGGGRTFVRLSLVAVAGWMAATVFVRFVPGQWPWERCRLQKQDSPSASGRLAAAGFCAAIVFFALFAADASRLYGSSAWCAAGLVGAHGGIKGVSGWTAGGAVAGGVECGNSRYRRVAELELGLLLAHLGTASLNLLYLRRSGEQGTNTAAAGAAAGIGSVSADQLAGPLKKMPVGV
eukprot:SAG22_NODE_3469_length_1691_cov_2.079146_1_plen_310_part_00